MPRFRARRIEVDAVQWTGVADAAVVAFLPAGVLGAIAGDLSVTLHAPGGDIVATVSDFIIKTPTGELYIYPASLFGVTYGGA